MSFVNIPLPLKRILHLLAAAVLLLAQVPQSAGASASISMFQPRVLYDNLLATGWQDWSWGANIAFNASSPTHSSPYAIAVAQTETWGALYLHHTDVYTAGYTHLRFFVHGGPSGGQPILVTVNEDDIHTFTTTAPAGSWGEVSIPLVALGSPTSIHELYFQGASNSVLTAFYLDDIALINPNVNYVPRVWLPLLISPSFVTLPPGSQLPTDAECAARVRKRPEIRSDNAIFNATKGSQLLPSNFYGEAVDPRANTVIAARVTGNFTGTTDEILQWAACKWGVDENLVRAQAAIESWWHQNTLGDWTTDNNRCAPGRGPGVDDPERPGECPESFGILQTRYPYMQGAWPSMENSTAFNADLAYAGWRACYEGYEWWLNDVERGWDYAAGDVYGCVGRWFSGRWHTQAAEEYIVRVRGYYESRIWETRDFLNP